MPESQPSRIPRLLVLVALAVLAIAFGGALLGSWRKARWDDAQRKADLVEPELANAEALVADAEGLDERWSRAASALGHRPSSSPELGQLRELLRDVRSLPRRSRPAHGAARAPSRSEVLALEAWLDLAYRRLAAARDLQARLPAVEQEVVELERRAASEAEEASRPLNPEPALPDDRQD